MKKMLLMMIAVPGMAISAFFSSCAKDEQAEPETKVIEVIKEVHDTVVTTDTVYLVNGDHLLWIANQLLDQGRECDWLGINLDMNASYLDAEKYLIWLGYLGESGFHRWEYNPHHDERAYSFDDFDILSFYDTIVIPCYDYVMELKKEGWGKTTYTTWMNPNDFLNQFLKDYHGNDVYASAMMATSIARDYYIFGAK